MEISSKLNCVVTSTLLLNLFHLLCSVVAFLQMRRGKLIHKEGVNESCDCHVMSDYSPSPPPQLQDVNIKLIEAAKRGNLEEVRAFMSPPWLPCHHHCYHFTITAPMSPPRLPCHHHGSHVAITGSICIMCIWCVKLMCLFSCILVWSGCEVLCREEL